MHDDDNDMLVTTFSSECVGTRLLVSSHKSVHFLYDVHRPHLPPLAEYRSHSSASFYVRAAFSPDGTHFISGSSENNAYIWEVRV